MEFEGIPGRKVADESGPEFIERGDALMGEHDGFGCEAVFDGVEPDDQSTFRRHLSFGQTCVANVRGLPSGGNHNYSPETKLTWCFTSGSELHVGRLGAFCHLCMLLN